ncbi:hypothetical protein TGVAND_464970 [Toxoplasma gondii VAND]|uniref:Uncharacterized protein n=1 Tax=Toxoplasma gondii VAND TaxID=933077 RepID=A0A086QHT8_TOXGO|nr:hypothetical protein TGVAND_464970 [Toxoplasma gondii VAND]
MNAALFSGVCCSRAFLCVCRHQGSGGIWYMRVVLLDLLLQTIWEAAHHHPGLLGFTRSSSFFSSLHAASGSSSLSSSVSSFLPASGGSPCPPSRLRRGRGTGVRETLDAEVEESEGNACRGAKRQKGEGTAEGVRPSEATRRGREPSYIRDAFSDAAMRPPAFRPTYRHGDEDSDEDEGVQRLLKEERSMPGSSSDTQTKGDVNNVESRAREERNSLRARRKRRTAKQVTIAYILSKVEGANSDVQRQMWSLLVVRLCESAGAAFASSSSLGLLLPLLRVLGERYVCVLKSLSSLAVSSGRHRASASSLVGHFVALAQALSSLLLLPLYPRLGLNGAMTSEGPADALDETPIGETTMKPAAPLDAHKWRLGDRKGQTARGEKGGRERHEALSRVRDACDTAEERLDCRMLDLPSSPASRAASATTSPSARSRCISERREEPAMSVEVFKSGDELEGVASVAGDGTESDDYGSEEETSSAWKIPVLSSQLLNHAAIISTLKHAARGPMGLSALPWFSSRFCAVPASHVNGGPMDTCGDLGGTRLETVPSLVALAAPSSSCVTSSLPVSLLLASLSHASAVLEALVQQQRQMTTTVALDSGDSSSLTFSPQFVFASFSRVLQLLLLLLPRALTRGAVPLLLAPPFLPSISTLASHSAALPGRQTSSGVDPGPGIPPLRVFSSSLFPPSPWLLELFSVLVLRHPSLISPSSTDALLRYLLPHVLSPDPKGAGPWRFDAEKTRRPSKSGSRKNTQEEASLAEETGLTEHPMARLWMPYAFARPLPSSSASRASTAWASLASLSLWSLFPLLLRNMARRGTMEDADSAPLQSVRPPSATNSRLLPPDGPVSTLSVPLPRTSVGLPSFGSSPPSLQDAHSVSQTNNPRPSLTRFCDLVYCRSACPSASPLLLSFGTADQCARRTPQSLCSTVSRSPSPSVSATLASDDSTEIPEPMCICKGPREAPAAAGTLSLSPECSMWSDSALPYPLACSVGLLAPAAIYRDRYQTCQSLFIRLLRLSEMSSLSSPLLHSSAPFAAAAEGVPSGLSVGALASSASSCWQTESRFNDISSLFRFLPLPLVPSLSCPSPLVLLRTSRPSSAATPQCRPSDPGCASRSPRLHRVGWHAVPQQKTEKPEDSLGDDQYSAAVIGLPLATETASLSSRFPERVIGIFYSSHVETTLEFLSLFHVQASGRCRSQRGRHTQDFYARSCSAALPSRSTCSNAAPFASASSTASASLDARKLPWETARLLPSVSLSVAVAAASRFLRSLRIASLVLPAELWVAPLARRRPGTSLASGTSRNEPSDDMAMFTTFKSTRKTRRSTEGALSDSASPTSSRVSSSSGSDGSGDRECDRRIRKVGPVGEKDAQRLTASLSGRTRTDAERGPRKRLLWRPLEACAAGCATWLAVECLLGLFLRSLHPHYTSRVSGGFCPAVRRPCTTAESPLPSAASAGDASCFVEPKRKDEQPRRIEARRPHGRNETRSNGILGRERDVCSSETLSRSDSLNEDKNETSARRSADSDCDSASHQPRGQRKAFDVSWNLLVERQQQREAPGDRSRVRKSQDELNDSSPDPSHVEALWKLWTESFVILQSQGLPSQPVCFACDLAHGADAVPVGRRTHGEGLCFVAEKGQKVNDAEAGREKEIWERDAFRVHSGEQAGGYAGDRQEKGPKRNSGASVIPSEKPGVNAGESTGEAMHGGDRRDVRRSEWMSCDGAKATGSRAFGVEWESQRETRLMALESSGSRGPVASPEVTATGSVAYWRLYSFSSSPRLTCMHLQLLASLVVASVSRSVPARTPLDSSCRRGEALSLRLSSFFLNSWRLHETIQGRWTEDNEDEEHARVANAVAGRWSRSSDEDREVCREVSVLSSFSNRNSDTEGHLGKAAAFAETDTEMDAGKSGDVFESSQDALVPSTFTLMRLLLTSLSVFSVFSSAPDSCFCPCSVQLHEAIRGFTDRRGKEEVSPLGSFLCTHNMRGCTTNGKAFDPSTPVKERGLCMQDPGEDRQDNLQASVEFFCQDLCETKSHPTTCGASDKGAGVSVSSFAPLSGTDSSHPAPFHHRPLWAVCVELLHALVAGASASSFLHLEAATRGSEPASSCRTSWESIAATDGDERMSRDGCRSSFLASETDAGERQRQGMSHDHPEGERQELRYGCERLVRPLSSFSSSLSRSPASLEALWARGGGPAIFGQFFECMRIEDPQAQRLAKGEGETFVGRDEAGKRTLSLLDAVASVTAMEASLALLQPIASMAMRGRRFGVSDTPLSNKQTAKCAALDGFNLAPMFGLRFGRTQLIVGSYTEPPSPSSPAGHFLKKAMNAKSVLTAVVEIFSEHTPMFGEEMEERDPHTLGPEPLTASCPGGFSVLPAALSVVGQLIAELLALARREQAAVGKAVVDVLASLIVERNAPLLLGREQEKEESDVEDFSGRAVDEASEATRSQASDASKGRGSGMGETETPLTDNDLTGHDGRGDKNKEIWVLSAAAREERHQRQSRKGDGPDLRLQDNKDYQLEPTMAEVSLRLAPSTVCVLLEAFEAAEVFRDLLKPSPCHAAVSAGGDEHLTHAAGSRNQFQSSATATDWSHGYIPCGDLVSLLALSAACVGVPDLTGDALWALLQGHDLAAAALNSLHVSHRYLPMSDRAPSMLSASSELPSAPEIVPSLPRHRSGLHQLSRCNLADADGLACNAPALRTGRDKDGEWISEEPRKESGKDWQAGRETVAVVRDVLSTALSRLASPLREALSHVLSMIADHQSLPSVQELCLSHLPFFFVQWLSLRKRVRHAHDSTVGVRTRFEMLEAHALVEEAKASERGGEIEHSRIPDLPPKRSSCVQLPLEGYPQVTAISCQQWLGGCLLKLQREPTGTEKKRVTDEESTLILTFADCDGFFSGLSFLTACEALARCLSPPPQGVPADNPEAASSEACDEEGMDSSHSDAATRREGHRGVVLSATLSARDAANLGGGNRGRMRWGLGDSSYGATGRGDSARAKVGERGDRNALLDDLGKRRMMHTEEEDVGEGLCVEQAEDFLKMCLSLHAPRRTFTLNAFPGPQETEDDDGEVQEVGGSSASARRSAGLKSDGRPCEDAAHPTSGTSAFTSFPFLQYFWDAENMPSSQAWALRQARPVFVNARQEASFYLTVSSAANELLSVFVTSQERKAKALLVGLASRQLATRSRQPGCGAGRVSVAHSLSPRKATKDLQVSRAEGCEEGEDLGDDDGGRRTTPLSPHDLKAHLLLYICGNNELNTTWRHLGARLLFTLPATNLATLRDVLPVQNPRHERCLSGALSCHELVSLLFRFFAPFADETAERKETRSQTRRLFNHEELEEKRENPKTKQQVQPIQLLTVLGLVATSATLCDPGAPHALRVVALLSLQNVRPPGGKRLSPSLLSSLSVTSSLSSSFPASYHVGRGNLRGLSTAALSRHAEPGRAEDESEPANELEIEDVERLARMIGCASPSMALITSTVAQISREDDAPALLNL